MALIEEPGISVSDFSANQAGVQLTGQAKQLEDARLQQKISNSIADAAASANQQMNEMLSAMLQPIYDIIQQFKTIPPKIRSIVDIDGAANGMYNQLGKAEAIFFKTRTETVSSEVPIELEDYLEDPTAYENLMAIEYQNNDVTEDDCLKSGYTKVKWETHEILEPRKMDTFPAPQDRDIVGKQMEKLIGSTIKQAWQIVKPPVNTIASIANIGPIPEMIQTVIDAVDGIVKIASKVIPEEQLNAMLAQKQLAQDKGQGEAEKNQEKADNSGGQKSLQDKMSDAMAQAKNVMSQAFTGVTAGIQESFANFQAPSIPDDIKETIEDFKDAIIMVKDNISNIYIVVILKMLEAVFKCFNQILGVIGVPNIPDPLGKIPQIIMDAMNIIKFVMGLPMSLVQCLTAIIKRKIKAVQIAMLPAPPQPLPEKIPLPPTSKDVVKPQDTWDDVKKMLTDAYKFNASDTEEIISKIQEFYNGSDEETRIITGVNTDESSVANGKFNDIAVFETVKRYKMTPSYCKNTWIPAKVNRAKSIGEGYYYFINPPIKTKDTKWSGKFHMWTSESEDVKFNYDDDWSLLKEYTSALDPS